MTSVLVNVSAGKESVGEPWIWRLSRDFNVKVSVVRANVDTDFGFMQLDVSGEVEDVQRSIAWLMTTGLHVEAQSRSVGA
jgi:L-aspartate semialdehyde sulfurtransferase ferredoxin